MKKRIVSLLLCLTMLIGLMPTAAFATGGGQTTTDKNVMLGVSGISGYNNGKYDYIYYGNWTALDDNTTTGPIKW